MAKGDAEKIAIHLGGKGGGYRDKWLRKCPLHTDKTASLSISEKDGQLLLWDFGGCKFDDLINHFVSAGVIESLAGAAPDSSPKVTLWFEHPEMGSSRFGADFDDVDYQLKRPYVYRLEDGTPQYAKVRFVPKTFRYFHWADGKLKRGKPSSSVTRVPYRLPQLMKDLAKGRPIHIPEGEKDCENLVEVFGLASTTFGGATEPLPEAYGHIFAGGRFVVWCDNNDAGLQRGREVAEFLHRNGAEKIKMTTSQKGIDISNWIDFGLTRVQLDEHLKEVPLWVPTEEQVRAAVASGAIPQTPHDLGSDAFLGEYYVHKNHESLRYLKDAGVWYAHNGKFWEPDKGMQHKEAAKFLHVDIRRDMDLFDPSFRKDMLKAAKDVQTISGYKRTIESATSIPKIQALRKDFDPNNTNHLFNCADGIINMKTMDVLKHSESAGLMITHYVDLRPNYKKDPKRFIDFLLSVYEDEAAIPWFQTLFGYFLTGETHWQKFPLFRGEPGTGKSTIVTCLTNTQGSSVCNIDSKTLRECDERTAGAESDIAGTAGKRLIIAAELTGRRRLDSELIKALTGQDVIRTKEMRENKHDLKTNGKLVFTANNRPVFSEAAGIERRIIEIPSEKKFQKVVDGFAESLLSEEAGAILAWRLEGACMGYAEESPFASLHQLPDFIEKSTESIKFENDTLQQFIADRFIEVYSSHTPWEKVYQSFTAYCKMCAIPVEFRYQSFIRKMIKLGYESTKNTQGVRSLNGYAIREA